jgi:alkylation response protein AidB-like acyl-CoA dehydrogenase
VTRAPADLDTFRDYARTWIEGHLSTNRTDPQSRLSRAVPDREHELEEVNDERALQRRLYDAGLAGICVPVEYGGQGLSPAHQGALNTELAGREYPDRLQVPTMNPCLSVLLEFGTEEQKHRHIPAILRGDEIWAQFLSEPSGGSDVAGALTTASRDGDEWVLNGSKVWTTGAWWSDWGLCLARTNWDVPKHRGLTVFTFPIHQPSVEIHQIEMLNGSKDFCQEFMTDLRVPDADRIGDIDQGWTVGTRWMFHEKMLHNSPMVTYPTGSGRSSTALAALKLARSAGRDGDVSVRALVGEARMLDLVGVALRARVAAGVHAGTASGNQSAIARLYTGVASVRSRSIGFEIAGSIGASWTTDDSEASYAGIEFLMRQVSCIGGGTTEMARNVISERVLGMPREPTLDRDVPFRDVPRN